MKVIMDSGEDLAVMLLRFARDTRGIRDLVKGGNADALRRLTLLRMNLESAAREVNAKKKEAADDLLG